MNAKDLLKAGYRPGPQIDDMLAMIAKLQARGIIHRKYLFKILRREFGDPPPAFTWRERPRPFGEAIQAITRDEKENLRRVREKMSEILRNPVISGGAIMPDACPAGPAATDIPVGGVVAVENAIIPAAHSSDICCSIFATFYEPRTAVADELDALTSATRFGPGGRHHDDLVDHPVLHEEIWENKFLGNDNEKFHSFAPHGAGRNHSRTALLKKHRGADHRRHLIEHHTRNIDVRWFNGKPDLSETPIAYKDPDEIRRQIHKFHLATIVGEIKPLGCLMAGGKKRREEEELTPKQIRQISHRKNRRREKQNLRDLY
jgi:hypothetical protein